MAVGSEKSVNGCVYRDREMAPIFKEEELRDLRGLTVGEGFIEVTCGCTSRRYGDSVGKLKIFESGELEINCDCFPGCPEDKLTPAAFEKHAEKEYATRWKYNIWVMVNGKKVPLLRTSLLKYHEKASKSAGSSKGHSARKFHRDEFIQCTKCSKARRFRLQSKEECRIYHDALADREWTCANLPFEMMSCDDDEERASRKRLRGCSRLPACKGCLLCVCLGCELCRFSDCNCQTCVDFVTNADI